MRNTILIPIIAALSISHSFAQTGEPATPGEGSPPAQHQNTRDIRYVSDLLISFKPTFSVPAGGPVDPAKLHNLNALAGVTLKYNRDLSVVHTFRLKKKLSEAEAERICKKILADADVEACSPDYAVQMEAAPMTNPDTYFANGTQWNLGSSDTGAMRAVDAWNITTGSSNVVVGFLDTGIVMRGATAPFFYHADWDATRILPGYNFATPVQLTAADPGDYSPTAGCPPTVTRSSWHGTAVAGVFGAATNNGAGIAGVDWAAKILPARIAGMCQAGTSSGVIAAMRWAAGIHDPAGVIPDNPPANWAKILNMSLTFPNSCGNVAGLQAAIDDVRKRNVVIVAAAGNDDGADVSLKSPASCKGVITVGSITRSGGKGTGTVGSRIDVSAPGVAKTSAFTDMVLSTADTGITGPNYDNAYLYFWGTSFATPHVTGTVSLMRAVNPTMTGQQLRKLIRQSAAPFPISFAGGNCTTALCGQGILDAGKAVALAKARTKGGLYHDLSLKTDGTVWSWGFNGNGQLGTGALGATVTAPVQMAGLAGMSDVSAGTYHSVAAKSDGTVWAWGYNFNGELGNGTVVDQSAPVQATALTGVIAVAAGDAHTLALKSDGTVWAWGYNFNGQLGAGSFDYTDRSTPVQVINLTNVVAIAAGGRGSMAVKNDGTVWVWGGYKTDMFTTLPTDWYTSGGPSGPYQVPGLSNIVAVSASGASGGTVDLRLAISGDGLLYAWGNNEFGELGQGSLTPASSGLPLLVSALSTKTITNAVTSGTHVVAIADDGTQWAWGDGFYGQLGDGVSGLQSGQTYDHYTATPIQIATSLPNVADVAVGTYHTIAMNADTTLSGWGYNGGGQLGNGTTVNSSAPVQVIGSTNSGVFNILNTSSAVTDVQITVTNSPNPVQAGQNLTYTMSVANVGSSPASNVVANLALPASATFVSASPGCVFSANASSVACTIGTLAAAANVNLQVIVTLAAAAGVYDVTANVRTTTLDSNLASNVAGTSVTIPAATATNADVPTLPEWGMIVLGLALIGITWRAARKMQPPRAS
jgi:uncharacterized repeat protein (TIGR01451 family)